MLHFLGEIILYTTEDGQSRVECRFESETIWLSQALIAELFDRDVRTINEHLQNIFQEKELNPESTIRKFRIVRQEGEREVSREIEHYNLEAILAVGFRVKSPRGTQFRRWANTRLQEYLVKGVTMDDERLKNPPVPGSTTVPDYFDELLARILYQTVVPSQNINTHFGVESILSTNRLIFLETHESVLELLEAIPGFQGSRNTNLSVD